MSQKQIKRERRRYQKIKNLHNEEFANYLISLSLWNRIKISKQILKGNDFGISLILFLIIINFVYIGVILIIFAIFNEKILFFLKKIAFFLFFS